MTGRRQESPRGAAMRTAVRGALLAGVVLSAPSAGDAAVLYAAEADGPSTLYEMDPDGGALTPVGPIGYAVLGLAVHPTTAALYGVTPLSDPAPARLLAIDPATGEGEVVGDPLFPLVIESAADLTFTSDGTLYGWMEEASDSLVTIDPATGRAAGISDSGLVTFGSGLAADPEDVLYLAGEGDAGALHRIDRMTGLSTGTVQLTGSISSSEISALAFHPATGTLYGVAKLLAGGALITIDPGSGAIDVAGSFAEDVDAIAFGPHCGDGERDRPWEACDDGNTTDDATCSADCTVPEPGQLALALVGGVVLLVARAFARGGA